ncbi:MAG: hypothetical protein E7Z85_00965 [Methanosphaera stadtmanae]|nr:hypothetical protein [Methanosphaera stadtmanae]
MKVNMDGVTVSKKGNGIIFKSENPFYILANRDYFDFKYINEFDNHYYNQPNLERILVEKDGISIISTVEFFEKKFFTNITVLLDVDLDNVTLLNIYRTVIETISTVSWQVNAINKDELSNKLGNYYNMIYIACTGKSEKIISFDISLFYEVKELVEDALTKSFNNLGYFKK